MDKKREAAWRAAIAKLRRRYKRGAESAKLSPEEQKAEYAKLDPKDDISSEEHYALLREGMFEGKNKADIQEEAFLFLEYWLYGLSDDPIPWLGEMIANHWFWTRDWDRKWGRNYAEKLLWKYINATDFDHWDALNKIAARLHRERQPFPESLADWVAERLEGAPPKPKKKQAHKGGPPYARENRNNLFVTADSWLKHYGMKNSADRIHVITEYFGDKEDVVRKGLTRSRNPKWRRAPWPGLPSTD